MRCPINSLIITERDALKYGMRLIREEAPSQIQQPPISIKIILVRSNSRQLPCTLSVLCLGLGPGLLTSSPRQHQLLSVVSLPDGLGVM